MKNFVTSQYVVKSYMQLLIQDVSQFHQKLVSYKDEVPVFFLEVLCPKTVKDMSDVMFAT